MWRPPVELHFGRYGDVPSIRSAAASYPQQLRRSIPEPPPGGRAPPIDRPARRPGGNLSGYVQSFLARLGVHDLLKDFCFVEGCLFFRRMSALSKGVCFVEGCLFCRRMSVLSKDFCFVEGCDYHPPLGAFGPYFF